MKLLLTISLLAVLVQVTSCKKYLDKKTDNGLTTINRVEDMQAMLDYADIMNISKVPVYGEASSDDYFLTESNFNNNSAGDPGRRAYTWQYFISGDHDGNDWEKSYLPINVANICLENIERFAKMPSNILQWNNIKGSALFIRAFYFLNLSVVYSKAYDPVTSHTDLGIALRLGTDIHVPTVRATVVECYRQIIKDAKEAVSYLPEIAIHPLRPSKAAAYGLLARTYLSMCMYDSAGIYADSALQIRSDLIDYNGDADIVNGISGFNAPFKQYNKETIFYADMSANGLYYVLAAGYVDTSLYDGYSMNDLRKTAFFMSDVNGYQKFKGNYTQSTNLLFGGITTSEMLLIRAESYARGGMLENAMGYLNALLIKRWKNTVTYPVITATDPIDALNKVLIERRKELLFRGLRWPDIKRLNKQGANILLKRQIAGQPYELLPNSDKYALPLPEDIIQLTGISQNTGWK